MLIGLLSDTHGYLDKKVVDHFKKCDEIWHVGDFGSLDIVTQLQALAPVVGVYGNIDGWDIRSEFPQHQRFKKYNIQFWMTHIGGTPSRYENHIRDTIIKQPPDVFICGHTHILMVKRVNYLNNMLHINPGAAGLYGSQVKQTIITFDLSDKGIQHLKVIEW